MIETYFILIHCLIIVEPNVTKTKRQGRGFIKSTCRPKKPDEYGYEGKTYSNL